MKLRDASVGKRLRFIAHPLRSREGIGSFHRAISILDKE